MEDRSNVDDADHKIRKSHDEDVKDRDPKVVTPNFRVQFCKGMEEEFPE